MQGTVDGTAVFTVSAEDPDLNTNGDISFSLEDQNLPFVISQSEGVISVLGELDYEIQNEYTVIIISTLLSLYY